MFIDDLFTYHTHLKELNSRFFLQLSEKEKNTTLVINEHTNFTNKILPNHLYYIKSGYVKSSVIDKQGNLKSFDILGPSEFLGLNTLFHSSKTDNPWLFMSLEDVTLAVIPFFTLDPTDKNVFDILYKNFFHQTQKIHLSWYLSSLSGYERVFTSLILLVQHLGKQSENYFILPKFVTHSLLAEFSNVSRPYVTKVLLKLENKQLVRYRHHIIKFCNNDDMLAKFLDDFLF
ncbi:Crp/Fnr family transcriptional regulator [Candidatus Enterococcus mansonii]|uniref:Cyclic nucleotide-binding domain-containing protein n=1 Tax=Candidatus Enterococcus mansonii TaxID=1834181 RepID=A0A242CIF6_9ENTE|nr:Crp/Fnr family transcriptional regulator [Enterococcus sp. 4G2_DIV0659]OTO09562.1 hypothetical protein A5880_000241 [Enterococcus sp. 4G2_DIV0659]